MSDPIKAIPASRMRRCLTRGELPRPLGTTRHVRSDPWEQPATLKAADGITTLHRYVLIGVIYAPTLKDAEGRVRHSDIDAAEIYRA